MSNEPNHQLDPSDPMTYQIRVKGQLGWEWADWFGGLTITLEDDGETLITGPVVDQAALHGLLRKVRDLGMPLISVNHLEAKPQSQGDKRMDTTIGCPDGTNRKTATIVGVLFIIGTVSGVLAASLGAPILNAPDYLIKISLNEGQIILVTLLQFIMGVVCAGIGLALYPILKNYSEGLAIGSAGFRIIEGVLDIVGAISLVALLALGKEFVKAGAPPASYFQTAGVLINAGSDWVNNVAVLLSWCIGALMYYFVFYQYKLVPRWLSVWGLIGITLTIIGCLLVMFQLIPAFGTIQVVFNLPIIPQEMVFAIWLIAKGINPSTVASRSAQIAIR